MAMNSGNFLHYWQIKMAEIVFFCQYLHEIFPKFKKESQFCNLLVLSFSKLTLLLIFGQEEAQRIEVKDTRGRFHFSPEYVQNQLILAVVMTLLGFKNLNFTSCINFCDIFHTNNPAFHKKNTKKIDFKFFFLKLLRKMIKNYLKM